jgi:hypothetical protein
MSNFDLYRVLKIDMFADIEVFKRPLKKKPRQENGAKKF